MSKLSLITPTGTVPRVPEQPLRVVGIDLGTTNSTIAEIIWQPGDASAPEVRCLEVEQPTRQGPYTGVLVPSVVACLDDDILVGEGAKELRTRVKDFRLELYRLDFGCARQSLEEEEECHMT